MISASSFSRVVNTSDIVLATRYGLEHGALCAGVIGTVGSTIPHDSTTHALSYEVRPNFEDRDVVRVSAHHLKLTTHNK